MTVYPKRDKSILDCVSPYVMDVIMFSEIACDVSGGACTWIAKFKPKMYNVTDPTYSWLITSGTGVIFGSATEETVEVHVTSALPELFDLQLTMNCTVNTAPSDVVFTKEVTTSVM